MRRSAFIFFFAIVLGLSIQAQTFLRVSTYKFGIVRNYEVFNGEQLVYKLKGDFFYRKNKIVAMQDSSIVFDNADEIKLNQIKALRLNKHIHLVGTLQFLFAAGAVAFVGLNTVNDLIVETHPIINEKSVYVSAALLATSFLIREFDIKRIRMNKHKDLKILTHDFQHLNSPDSTVKQPDTN